MRTIATTFVFLVAISLIAAQLARGDSSTWNLNPTSGDWNTAANWTPTSVPNDPYATAIFDVSNTTNVSLSGRAVVGEIIFNPGASAFMITSSNRVADVLSLVSAGLSHARGVETDSSAREKENEAKSFALAKCGVREFKPSRCSGKMNPVFSNISVDACPAIPVYSRPTSAPLDNPDPL